jgi:hypothetical protein
MTSIQMPQQVAKYDPAPHVPAAGGVQNKKKLSEGSAADCVRPDIGKTRDARPTTPDSIKKYRQSYQRAPGNIFF